LKIIVLLIITTFSVECILAETICVSGNCRNGKGHSISTDGTIYQGGNFDE